MEFVSPEDKTKIIDSLVEQDAKYPVIKNADGKVKYFGYGTAGFRTTGAHLDRVCFRVGILVAMRSKLTTLSGVCITASHNQKEDNGVKIMEQDGSMLHQSWEPLAEELVNAEDLRAFFTKFDDTEMRVKFGFQESVFAPVSLAEACFACDTRESSPQLVKAALAGCETLGVKTCNFGLCTTPQLHWLVSQRKTHFNDAGLYAQFFHVNYQTFLALCGDKSAKKNYQEDLLLDCANGVGSLVVNDLLGFAGFTERLNITLINQDKTPENLNAGCGAEHVQKEQTLPTGWVKEQHANKKCLSFDGDADRQIYFYGDAEGNLKVVDGDKQFALIMLYVQSLLAKLGLQDTLSHILVQTAYCNSRVTTFLNKNNVKNQLVKTGVKYAHPVVQEYDIGANDEPNGHGTVAYKAERLQEVLGDNNSIEAQKLKAILAISNVVVGDSIANMLVMEAILFDMDMSIQQFSEIYQENPSKLYKIVVSDRTKFKTNADESRLVEPLALQEKIDEEVAKVTEGKAFVRPSGTEDILRLYSEATTVEEMNALAANILQIVEADFKDF